MVINLVAKISCNNIQNTVPKDVQSHASLHQSIRDM